MSCDLWRGLIVDRLADELAENEAVLLEQHLAECVDCAAEEHRLRHLLRSYASQEEYTTAPSIEERLLEHMRARTREDGSLRAEAAPRPADGDRRWWKRLPNLFLRPIPAYVAMVLIAGAALTGLWFGRGGEARPESGRAAEPGRSAPQAPIRGTGPEERFARADHPSSDLSSTGNRRESRYPGPMRFVTTPSDAVSLAEVTSPDTL